VSKRTDLHDFGHIGCHVFAVSGTDFETSHLQSRHFCGRLLESEDETMLKTFLTLAVGGLSAMVLASPVSAGDGANCKSKSDCKQERKIDRQADKVERKSEKRAEKRMDKIESFSFHQSGGFMGVDKSYDVKLADLQADEREKLEALIKSSGILQTNGEERITKGAADMFVYQFSVNDGNKNREITFDDGTLPAGYRAIVDFTKDKMTDNRRR
jgi:hypothetical protein